MSPANRVIVIPISGALAKFPLDLASESFLSVGGSVFELLSTSDIGQGSAGLNDIEHNLYGPPTVFQNIGRDQQNDSLIDFMSMKAAKSFLTKLTSKYQLCEKINKLDKSSRMCFQYHLKKCNGACIKIESVEDYNSRYESSYSQIFNNPKDCCLTFNIEGVKTYVNIENNKVVKFGVKGKSAYSIDFPSSDEIRIVNMYKNRFSKNFKIYI